MGEWNAQPRASVRKGIEQDWKDAIVRYPARHHEHEYHLSTILAGDTDLGERWLTKRIEERSDSLYLQRNLIEAITKTFNLESRRCMIQQLPGDYCMRTLLCALVGEDVDLYRDILQLPNLRVHHLAPLQRPQSAQWTTMAMVAMEYGYTPGDVAFAARGAIEVRMGKESAAERGWLRFFEDLRNHPDEQLRKVGQAGCERVEPHLKRILQQEHDEEIYGR